MVKIDVVNDKNYGIQWLKSMLSKQNNFKKNV